MLRGFRGSIYNMDFYDICQEGIGINSGVISLNIYFFRVFSDSECMQLLSACPGNSPEIPAVSRKI